MEHVFFSSGFLSKCKCRNGPKIDGASSSVAVEPKQGLLPLAWADVALYWLLCVPGGMLTSYIGISIEKARMPRPLRRRARVGVALRQAVLTCV